MTPTERIAAALHGLSCEPEDYRHDGIQRCLIDARVLIAADPSIAADLELAAAVRRLEATGLEWKVARDRFYRSRFTVTVFSESMMARDREAEGPSLVETIIAALP